MLVTACGTLLLLQVQVEAGHVIRSGAGVAHWRGKTAAHHAVNSPCRGLLAETALAVLQARLIAVRQTGDCGLFCRARRAAAVALFRRPIKCATGYGKALFRSR